VFSPKEEGLKSWRFQVGHLYHPQNFRSLLMTVRLSVLFVLGMTLLTATASAHHNMSGVFDFNDRVTLTGTLSKLDWRNPHIEIGVNAGKEGEVEEWMAEGPAPLFFRSRDTTKADFEKAIGKSVTLEVSRARDGSRSGLLRSITLPDGKVVNLCPENC
jgi:hypothetical protein